MEKTIVSRRGRECDVMPRKVNKLPPLDVLRANFTYNSKTGVVRRRYGNSWSAVGTRNSHGHLICRFKFTIYYVHRIAWALFYSEDAPALIDHKNGDGADNRIVNLRAATDSQNGHNRRGNRNSVSGIKGVHWSSVEQKWRSSIKVDGRCIHLGWFANPKAASRAYAFAAKKYAEEFGRA